MGGHHCDLMPAHPTVYDPPYWELKEIRFEGRTWERIFFFKKKINNK